MNVQRDGLFLADKESGITSHDAVDIFRRASRIRKVGHTGTLDPLATGLLVLCVGTATRLQSFLMRMEKTYEGTIQFGWATDTYDVAGTPLGDPREASIEALDLDALAEPFRGEIEQMPPQFSAKKVQGVRAYEMARKGEVAALEAKQVTIYELELGLVSPSLASFRVRCSAGTYVRTIAQDLGIATGMGAHLKSLRRTAIGAFHVRDAMATPAIREASGDELFRPPHFRRLDQVDLPLESVVIDRTQETKMRRGQSVVVKPQSATVKRKDLVSVRGVEGELVAIAEIADVLREGGGPVMLQPKVVLKG
ncbi:MAG TPA: tRNA pseudouridine(55) synthase TruB [Thermoanaerobaculia bacterium]|nr:tRNA pseudouridine(55) synthase TruB [Thermoanaerobaculia bacterium]